MNNSDSDFKAMMEKYQQELFQLKQQAIPVAAPASSSEQTTTSVSKENGNLSEATLQVRVTAANGAIPISGAVVTISHDDTATKPLHVLLTDISGLTVPVSLLATDPVLTQQPEENLSLVTYDILVTAPGYFSVRNSGVPLFGGIPTVQPVSMIPLPEFESPDTKELRFSVPKNNL